MRHPVPTLILLAACVAGLHAGEQVILPPEGTGVEASFACDKDQGPDKLFDGKEDTWMQPGGGTARGSDAVTSLILRFKTPLKDLAGVVTGSSDRFRNYYPEVIEFWGDSDGDGRCDTFLGRTDKLGPAEQCKGSHRFAARLPECHALEIRCVKQHVGGGKRAWSMNELRLITDDALPLATPTPRAWRSTAYREALPDGTTATVDVPCEDGKGAEALLDGDPNTSMNPKAGTAKEGQTVTVALRFPQPVADLRGIVLGRSDPYGNYRWEQLEVWADIDGTGACTAKVGGASGGNPGEIRFDAPVAKAWGLELRVTRQTLKGTMRAFMLNGIEALVFQDGMGDNEMRCVLEDFEDLSSWRTWADNTAQPEGERSYGGYTYICGVLDPKAPSGQAVGRIRYCFKEPKQPGKPSNWLRAKRGTVSAREAIMDAITFRANPQGYACSIHVAIKDAKGKDAHTPGVAVEGSGWKDYRIDLSPKAWPQGAGLTPPFRIENLWLHAAQGGTGDVLIDDLGVVGTVGRDQRVDIKPVRAGLANDPARPVTLTYRLRNALDIEVAASLELKLYSSFDPKRRSPVLTRSVPVVLPKWGEAVPAIDLGQVPCGHYEAVLSLRAPGVAAELVDQVAVARLNGGRINRSPMWIGATHPADWISEAENAFVFSEVVAPLGLDCYRTGAPDKRVMDIGLLCAAGFGGLPTELRKPEDKGDDRGEPSDYAAYEAWVKAQAAAKYAPYADRILAVEYYNEPDLPGFCYKPEIDTFLKMWRAFAAGFRAGAPGVKLGTGGNTVAHAKEKQDFNRRMYTELAQEADVAIWHAHGLPSNFTTRHRMVEDWLAKGGLAKEKMRLGNTEAGMPSFGSAIERLAQADCLVKKIGWAKAQADSLYYIWFTTTDTYDPQGGYLGGENWGLVTPSQRLKASGQAMNELVRQLANCRGLGETALDPRLTACLFEREDGGRTWLIWPNETGACFLQTLAASAPVELVDLFGRSETLTPKAGRIAFTANGYPMWLRAPRGAEVGPAKVPDWVKLPPVVGVSPGAKAVFRAGFASAWDQEVKLAVSVVGLDGKAIAEAAVALPPKGAAEQDFAFALPADLQAGTRGYILRLVAPAAGIDEALPLTVAVGEMVPRSAQPLVADGKPAAPARAGRLVVDSREAIQDFVDDPQTPKWAGKDDLSLTASLAHDGQGLRLGFAVRDQEHRPGEAGAKLWTADSVQVAIAGEGRHTEFGLTEAGGGSGFVWISPQAGLAGKAPAWPISACRADGVTSYEVYVPFADLGFAYRPGMIIRLSILVNEDDGRGRVRALKWFNGIADSKDIDRLGYLILE